MLQQAIIDGAFNYNLPGVKDKEKIEQERTTAVVFESGLLVIGWEVAKGDDCWLGFGVLSLPYYVHQLDILRTRSFNVLVPY